LTRSDKTRAALLAAASVLAASAALTPASASVFDPVAYPATVEIAAPVHTSHAAVDAGENAHNSARKWALVAAAAGALAGLVKLIGARRVAEIVTDGAVRTARAAATGVAVAARAVGRAAASPLRVLALFFGLSLFALTGVGLYDIEWIGGLVSGAALMALVAWSMWKTRMALRPIKAQKAKPPVRTNSI